MVKIDFRLICVLPLVGLIASTASASVYQLSSGAVEGSGYSFSGFIQTDGSITRTEDSVDTGCLEGQCFDSWEITLNTPDDDDGISTQLLTELNSTFELTERASSGGFVSVSTESIVLGFGSDASSVFSLLVNGSDERIQFIGANRGTPNQGMILIDDPSESPASFQAVYPVSSSGFFAFAHAGSIPEPTSAAIVAGAVAAAVLARLRRR
ncbi:hypothetical protein [Aeoliella sp.]|uniref:hypothetical protein n=1 Tax=Aeoliella sp. TaxID=2795800 RepID=UPI003CCBC299